MSSVLRSDSHSQFTGLDLGSFSSNDRREQTEADLSAGRSIAALFIAIVGGGTLLMLITVFLART